VKADPSYDWVNTINSANKETICLDLTSGEEIDGNAVQVWECNGIENQLWFFDPSRSRISYAGDKTKCLDAGSMDYGEQLRLSDCNDSPQQQWEYKKGSWLGKATVLLKANDKKCIGTSSYTNGNPAEIVDCSKLFHFGTSLNWNIVGGVEVRVGVDYKTCLNLDWDGRTSNGNTVSFSPCNGEINQKWYFKDDDSQVRYAGDPSKCLYLENSAYIGTQLKIWDCFDPSDEQIGLQKFGFDPEKHNIYLNDEFASGRLRQCLDIRGASLSGRKGTAQMWTCTSCWNQQFLVQEFVSQPSARRLENSTALGIPAAKLNAGDDCPLVPDFKPNDNEVLEITEGIVEGFILTDTFDLHSCVQKFESTAPYVRNGVVLIAKGAEKGDEKRVKHGLKQIAIALRAIPDIFNACKAGVEAVESLVKAIVAFSTPASFAFEVGQHIVLNGVNIYEEIKAAIEAWDKQDWTTFGKHVGMALRKVIVGQSAIEGAAQVGQGVTGDYINV